MVNKVSARGSSIDDKRTHCVSVRFNHAELTLLDSRTGGMQRGEYLRSVFHSKIPPQIPPANLDLHRNLGKSIGNLHTLAHLIRQNGYPTDLVDESLSTIKSLRNNLIGVSIADEPLTAEPESVDGNN